MRPGIDDYYYTLSFYLFSELSSFYLAYNTRQRQPSQPSLFSPKTTYMPWLRLTGTTRPFVSQPLSCGAPYLHLHLLYYLQRYEFGTNTPRPCISRAWRRRIRPPRRPRLPLGQHNGQKCSTDALIFSVFTFFLSLYIMSPLFFFPATSHSGCSFILFDYFFYFSFLFFFS